ncbi:MAG: DUF4238 domain-containing protein [Thermodesulfovibrionales bacterium]
MDYKKQHIVTAAYLKEWCDPRTPTGYTPYVWLVSKDGQSVDNKAPQNIFNGKDFYTVFDDYGNRNLELEHYLHKIEDDFLAARKSIQAKRPITDIELQSIVVFIASTFVRTKLQKREQKGIWNDLLIIYQKMGIDRNMPELYKQIENLKVQPLPYHITNFLNITVPVLLKMKFTIMVTSRATGFITSDNPVIWLDPSIWLTNKPLSFFGLESPYLEIILPLSPNFLAQLTWNDPEQYLFVDSQPEIVNEINKLMVDFSDEYVILNHDKPNQYWFSVG